MAKDRDLEAVDPVRLRRMFEDGHALLAEAVKADAVLTATLSTRREHGYYLHGAHDPSAKDPGGHLLHYRPPCSTSRRAGDGGTTSA